MSLADETCEAEVVALAPAEIDKLAQQVTDWSLKEKSIEREFLFEDFDEAMDFVDNAADLAAEQDHHPDILISYNRVRFTLSTHKVGGLSRNDFIMAAKINRMIEAWE
jgi:4a-hydroxytetrahydrobiopterin dehydratase